MWGGEISQTLTVRIPHCLTKIIKKIIKNVYGNCFQVLCKKRNALFLSTDFYKKLTLVDVINKY